MARMASMARGSTGDGLTPRGSPTKRGVGGPADVDPDGSVHGGGGGGGATPRGSRAIELDGGEVHRPLTPPVVHPLTRTPSHTPSRTPSHTPSHPFYCPPHIPLACSPLRSSTRATTRMFARGRSSGPASATTSRSRRPTRPTAQSRSSSSTAATSSSTAPPRASASCSTWSRSGTAVPSPTPSRSTRCSPLAHRLPTPSHTHRAPLCSPVHSLARPCTPLHTPSRALTHPPTAARQVQRGLHYLLHEDAQINEIRTTVDSRAKSLGMKAGRPKLLFKKCLFTKQDERLISEKAFIHLFFIQAAARPHAPAHTPRTTLTHPSHTPQSPQGLPYTTPLATPSHPPLARPGGQRRDKGQLPVQGERRCQARGHPLLRVARPLRRGQGAVLRLLHAGAAPERAAHAHAARHRAGRPRPRDERPPCRPHAAPYAAPMQPPCTPP